MELSAADPVPTSVQVLLGSTSKQFSWERCMQVLFFFFFLTNRCIKLSWAKRKMHKKKNVLFKLKLCILGGDMLLSKYLKMLLFFLHSLFLISLYNAAVNQNPCKWNASDFCNSNKFKYADTRSITIQPTQTWTINHVRHFFSLNLQF